MTNEDAIEQFQNAVDLIKRNGKDWLDERDIPMLEMAICALKNNQTDGDLISRTDLLNKIFQQAEGRDYYGYNMLNLPYVDLIKSMPTITTEPTDNLDILIKEYLSKCECCDECVAEYFCMKNDLRESREPQDYCISNIKQYFELQTAEPKTAEWKIVGKTTLHYECSKCGGVGDKWDKFCKHCGRKMKGVEEE